MDTEYIFRMLIYCKLRQSERHLVYTLYTLIIHLHQTTVKKKKTKKLSRKFTFLNFISHSTNISF